jgi:hypothetical protein
MPRFNPSPPKGTLWDRLRTRVRTVVAPYWTSIPRLLVEFVVRARQSWVIANMWIQSEEMRLQTASRLDMVALQLDVLQVLLTMAGSKDWGRTFTMIIRICAIVLRAAAWWLRKPR